MSRQAAQTQWLLRRLVQASSATLGTTCQLSISMSCSVHANSTRIGYYLTCPASVDAKYAAVLPRACQAGSGPEKRGCAVNGHEADGVCVTMKVGCMYGRCTPSSGTRTLDVRCVCGHAPCDSWKFLITFVLSDILGFLPYRVPPAARVPR